MAPWRSTAPRQSAGRFRPHPGPPPGRRRRTPAKAAPMGMGPTGIRKELSRRAKTKTAGIVRTPMSQRTRPIPPGRGVPPEVVGPWAALPEGYSGVVRVGRMGLLRRSGAGACPNLPQRRSGPGSAVNKNAEYQRFSSGVPARSGPLWQIWTTGAAAGPVGRAVARLGEVHDVNTGADTRAEGGRGPGGRPVRPHRLRGGVARPARRRPGPRDRHLTHEIAG